MQPFLKNKNPQVKEGTLKFLNRSLATTKTAPSKGDLKVYSEALVELMGDSVEGIRSEAQMALALLMKIFGERMMNPYLEPVDDLKKGKVKEAFEKATVKCKAGAPAPPLPPSKPAAKVRVIRYGLSLSLAKYLRRLISWPQSLYRDPLLVYWCVSKPSARLLTLHCSY